MNTTMPNRPRSIFQLLLTVVGLVGIAALFLPFTEGVSPADVVLAYFRGEDTATIWKLAVPFFLSVLVSSASLRWIVSGTLSRPERMIAHFVSVAIASMTLSLYWDDVTWPSNIREWLALATPVSTLILGVYIVIRSWRMPSLRELSALMSMQVAYLANCLLCLISFVGGWQIGAYFALVTAVVYSAQIAVMFVQRGAGQRQPTVGQG